MQNNRIKTGLIGLGRAGVQMHLHELDRFASLFQLTACCDVLPDRVENVRSRYPDAAGYTDPDAFFADPDVELVCIATPSRLHVQFARKALEAGKIVFLEKPFALSEAGLEQLRQLDKMYPGKLYLRHNRRFEACYNHVMELMATGIIGSVTEVKLRRLRHRFRDDWQTRLDCGGGQLNNWAPHLIDQSLHLLGSELESVWSDMRRVAARGDAEDHIKLLFRGRNGRIIDLEISDGVPVGEPVITVYGTRGMLVSRDERTIAMTYLDPATDVPPDGARLESPPISGPHVYTVAPEPVWIEKEIPVAPANGYSMDDIYRYLYDAIRDGVPFPVKNEEGFQVVAVTLDIRKKHPEFTAADDLL